MKRGRNIKTSINSKKAKSSAAATESIASPDNEEASTSDATINFRKHLDDLRHATATSISEFPFKKKRVRVLTTAEEVDEARRGGVLYWMSREARVQDNWAFLFAQKLAFKLELPLMVAFCLVPRLLNTTIRHYKFMLGGLQEVELECRTLQVPFYLLIGAPGKLVPDFVVKHNVCAVVCDFSPLRAAVQWVDDVKQSLPNEVPLTQVDAHNVVPVWVASDKQEYSARTIRTKINSKLNEFLTDFPPVVSHRHVLKKIPKTVDWKQAYSKLECDMSVDEVDWARPGYTTACAQLHQFCTKRLSIFATKRNDPTANAISDLSPWFNFGIWLLKVTRRYFFLSCSLSQGQISVQRCILEVQRYKSKYNDSVAAFCEEAIIRRELSDNFCYYNKNYDSLQGVPAWALKTLNDHRNDKRAAIYTQKEFEEARTQDDLWNSAQLQLVREAKMHGFLRMYWAKKILEWSESPEKAIEIAIYLNDKYSLDGHDPNGYVGCMWSIGGVHDQGWAERPIFGKVRFMNYQGCKRKFDVAAFVARYGGTIFKK